jgi:hypothetical protein
VLYQEEKSRKHILEVGPFFENESRSCWLIKFNNSVFSIEKGKFSKLGNSPWYLDVYDLDLIENIGDITISDIPKDIWFIRLKNNFEFSNEIDFYSNEIRISERDEINIDWSLSFVFHFSDWEHWKKPYSIAEYAETLNKLIKEKSNLGINFVPVDEESILNGFKINCNIIPSNKINDEISKYYLIFSDIFKDLNYLLVGQHSLNSVVSIFEFPEEVKVPCQQYLLYFVQFLNEIGISATAELKNEAGNVLFSVTPTSNEIALSQIRAALEIYLGLPSNNFMGVFNPSWNAKDQQLIANVQHLQSQLMMANAIMNTQSDTISNQQYIITNQQKLIDASVMQNSVKSITAGEVENDKEDILCGNVTLTRYEGNGFEINIPNIYRWVKEKILK